MVNIIGETIARLRKNKGLTQKQLADQLYISNKTVSKWENGTSLPDIQATIDLAKYFDITVDELLTGDEYIDNQTHEETLEKYKILIFINIFVMAISLLFVMFRFQIIYTIITSLIGVLVSIFTTYIVKKNETYYVKQSFILMNYINIAFFITYLVMLICSLIIFIDILFFVV